MKTYLWRLVVMSLLLGWHAPSSYAQTAEALLKATKAYYEKLAAFKVTLHYQIQHPALGLSETQSGKAFIQGAWYRLVLNTQDMRFDGTTLCVYYPEEREVTLMNPEGNMGFQISDLWAIYTEDFEFSTPQIKLVEGKRYTALRLRPKAIEHPYQHIELLIEPKEKRLYQYTVAHKDGQKEQYSLSPPEVMAPYKVAYYRCQEEDFPGIELIDLRL